MRHFLCLLIALLFFPVAAQAGDPGPATASKATRSTGAVLSQQPVYDRVQPGFEVPGIRLGDLMVHPSAKLMAILDNNVYATQANKQSDLITVVTPAIAIETLNRKRGLKFNAQSSHGFYADNSSENYNDLRFTVSPYLQMTRTSLLQAKLLWERNHELRTSDAANTNFGAEEPVRYTRALGRLFWQYKPGRFGFTPHIEHADIAYENVARRGGGPRFVNNDRDRSEDEIGFEAAYDFFGKNQGYWRNRIFRRDYERPDYNNASLSFSGPERDSKGVETRLGTHYFLTPITSVDLNGGYYHQDFDTGFKNVDTAVGQALLTWQVTGLTTCNVDAERRVWETAQDNASAFIQNRAGAKITHELRRNIILGALAGIGSNAYVGDPREDDYWEAGVSGLYKISRNWGWKTDYIYEERDSNVANADYSKHQVFLSLQVQF